ncbi:Sorbitol dehydrogenase [Leminorella richardii]|uniref:Sorbitol dehydrogenase n=1 Tax=Leminorella richardii TaxID=158841 RepID=A0A2X4UMB3_9GAMM|nr:zinc-dependent dehydrogenase [Leminorella richardii]SQI36748.1 Sorbitol dehydrogenase [Leminorella richardii]
MKAAYFYAPGDVRCEETDVPAIADNELLVEVKASSICGTDQRIFKNGHFKIPAGEKRVLGHEISGVIAQVGQLTSTFKVGQRVSFTPNIGCGHCEFCRSGYNQMCPDYEAFGISLDGGFQQYMRVPAEAISGNNLFLLPDNVGFDEASLIEPLSCCYNAFSELKVNYDDTVLVIGAGPIGACHVMLAKVAGAKKVIVADIRDSRLESILQFGADVTINSAEQDLHRQVMQETGGRGVDVVITAASVADLQTQSIGLLATHGRVCFFGGLGQKQLVPIDTNLVHYKGLKLLGTTGSSNQDYYQSLRLVAEGRINLAPLVSYRFPVSEINDAFATAASGNGMKCLIVNEGN